MSTETYPAYPHPHAHHDRTGPPYPTTPGEWSGEGPGKREGEGVYVAQGTGLQPGLGLQHQGSGQGRGRGRYEPQSQPEYQPQYQQGHAAGSPPRASEVYVPDGAVLGQSRGYAPYAVHPLQPQSFQPHSQYESYPHPQPQPLPPHPPRTRAHSSPYNYTQREYTEERRDRYNDDDGEDKGKQKRRSSDESMERRPTVGDSLLAAAGRVGRVLGGERR